MSTLEKSLKERCSDQTRYSGMSDVITSVVPNPSIEREFLIDNLLIRIHFIIVMIWWTGLAAMEV